MIDASLAQLVEHDTLNVGVQGSSPWGGTKEKLSRDLESFSFFHPPHSAIPFRGFHIPTLSPPGIIGL